MSRTRSSSSSVASTTTSRRPAPSRAASTYSEPSRARRSGCSTTMHCTVGSASSRPSWRPRSLGWSCEETRAYNATPPAPPGCPASCLPARGRTVRWPQSPPLNSESGAASRIRTCDPGLKRPLRYHCAMAADCSLAQHRPSRDAAGAGLAELEPPEGGGRIRSLGGPPPEALANCPAAMGRNEPERTDPDRYRPGQARRRVPSR